MNTLPLDRPAEVRAACLRVFDTRKEIMLIDVPNTPDARDGERTWKEFLGVNCGDLRAQFESMLPALIPMAIRESPGEPPLLMAVGLFQSFVRLKLKEFTWDASWTRHARIMVRFENSPPDFIQQTRSGA
jgi:hypothetical protein